MDIDLLSKMIKELILDKDEVYLPGIGSFVAELVPSTFSDKGYTVNPPYRRLYFRQKQDDKDTSLVDLYAESNNVNKASALQILSDFLNGMKEVLKQKKTIIFPGLGRLRATRENNFFFVADEELDIFPAGFGLEPVSLKTHQETEEEVSETLSNLKSIIEEKSEVPVQADPDSLRPLDDINARSNDSTDSESIAAEADTSDANITAEEDNQSQTSTDSESIAAEADTADANIAIGEAKDGAEKPKHKRPFWRTMLRPLIWATIIAIIALILFVIASHIFPQFIDTILYNQEELEILYQ